MQNCQTRPARPPQYALLFALFLLSILSSKAGTFNDLDRQFERPPRQAQIWVYWVWLADTTPAALTRDLEQMKAKGITGCILYNVQTGRGVNWWARTVVRKGKDYTTAPTDDYRNAYYTPIPTGPLPSWTPHWRDLVCYAAGEAGRLGIDFVVSDGLANTSGDISEQYGEQKLVWTTTPAHGPEAFDGTLPMPPIRQPKGDFPHPRWRGYHRDVAVLAVPDRPGFSAGDVINLSSKMDAAGHLHWSVPPGNWKIIRFVQAPTGAYNIWGYYTDSMSAQAMDKTWAVTVAPLLEQMTPDERHALKGIEDDSWEAGKATWTKLFPEEFQKRRGYDLVPYLPIIAGEKMSDADTRRRVLRDDALTISDLIADNHYGHLRKIAHDHGLIFYAEAAGPNFDQADLLKTSSRVDMAMAEFWMPSAHRPTMDSRFLLRNAANANHIYGNNITLCESFTSLGPEWEETPFTMKPVADQAFCDGLNKVCVHNFSQSPSLTARPGYVYCAGTHYDPGVTWWDQSPAFNTYLARCCFMLQQGKFVADALFYHGDNIGHGEQRKTILPTLGPGYDHDNCNSEVLLTRMGVRNGRIVLADGMTYRVLVLPDNEPMPLEDLKKIADLVEAGATVVGPPPTGMAGMILNPQEQQQFNALVSRLWGVSTTLNSQPESLNRNGPSAAQAAGKQIPLSLKKRTGMRASLGVGHVFQGQSARQVLRRMGVPPDFEVTGVSPEGTIDWIHRATDGLDIYYVASRWKRPENVDCSFRVSGKRPELWDPVTGQIRDATAFRQDDGRTIVPMQFGPCGSIFVVFRKPIGSGVSGTTVSNDLSWRVLKTISGPWTVHFDPKWGGPATVVFNDLVDWTNRPERGIKYYSGAAIYHKTFSLSLRPGDDGRAILDLGEVHELAVVRLNGRNLGVIWDKPARVDVTGAVRNGENDLEVTVVNLWPNRLKGDEALPKARRFTETNIHKFGEASPLLPSGWIGPVRLLVPM
ncbi:MAG: glycosyl hydrolase [Limisphaerales bacterium]